MFSTFTYIIVVYRHTLQYFGCCNYEQCYSMLCATGLVLSLIDLAYKKSNLVVIFLIKQSGKDVENGYE